MHVFEEQTTLFLSTLRGNFCAQKAKHKTIATSEKQIHQNIHIKSGL